MNEETIIKSFGNPTTEGITVELFKPMRTKGSNGLASKTWFLSWQKIGELVFEQSTTQPAEQRSETCRWERFTPSHGVVNPHTKQIDFCELPKDCPICRLKIEVVE